MGGDLSIVNTVESQMCLLSKESKSWWHAVIGTQPTTCWRHIVQREAELLLPNQTHLWLAH